MRDLPSRPGGGGPDAELERALVDLGRQIAYPSTPDLSATIHARLSERPSRRSGWTPTFVTRRWLAWVALALVLLAGGLLLLSPDARQVVADRLGLPGVTIRYLQPPPPGMTPVSATPAPGWQPPTTPSVPPPTPGGFRLTAETLGLGSRLDSTADAAARVAYRVLAPTVPELAAPDEVYLATPPAGGQIALVYQPRPSFPSANETGVGLLFTQFRGTLEPTFFGKGLPPGARMEQVTVAGKPAYWIEGGPHFFFYRDQSGRQTDERFRLAANVLLWEQDGLTLRLEGALSKEQVLRIAASVR